MTLIFLALAIGTLLGYLLRRRDRLFNVAGRVTTVSVYALLFLLGLAVGADHSITRNLHQLGLEAVALSLAGLIGSVFLAWLLHRWLFRVTEREE